MEGHLRLEQGKQALARPTVGAVRPSRLDRPVQPGGIRLVYPVGKHKAQAIARRLRHRENRHLQPLVGGVAASVGGQVVEDAVDGGPLQTALGQRPLVAAVDLQADGPLAPP